MKRRPSTELTYRVSIVIRIDRPELRGPTFAPVAPGTRVVQPRWYATQGQAVRVFASILRGDEDYPSEFVDAVSVEQIRANQSPRRVRRRVERERWQFETATESRRRALQVSAVRRQQRLGIYSELVFPLVWRFPRITDETPIKIVHAIARAA